MVFGWNRGEGGYELFGVGLKVWVRGVLGVGVMLGMVVGLYGFYLFDLLLILMGCGCEGIVFLIGMVF